jgi:hypothetical protein
MYVMSPLHTTLGAAGVKRRCTRSGATGKRCALSVVTTNCVALGPDAMALHQSADPLLAHAQAAGKQFAVHARPAILAAQLLVNDSDVDQQGVVAVSPACTVLGAARGGTREVARLPDGLIKTLTWDRGMELAQHKVFSMATDVDVFFCDPRSPWQRGTNENTNGLIRQYLPKGMDLSTCSQDDLYQIAIRLNTRPRKTLEYETPASRLRWAVAATG